MAGTHFLGDFVVAESHGYEPENIFLAIGQRSDGVTVGSIFIIGSKNALGQYAWRKPEVAFQDGSRSLI